MTDLIQTTFDYSSLDKPTAKIAKAAAAEIHAASKRCAENIVEIGKRLAGVKDILPHGSWLPWIEAEFGWTDRTARNFIQVYEFSKSEIISNLTPTVLYMLAAPSTPEPVREVAVELAKAGEKVTPRVVSQLKEAHKVEEKRRETDRTFAEKMADKNLGLTAYPATEPEEEPEEDDAEPAEFEMLDPSERPKIETVDGEVKLTHPDEHLDPHFLTFVFTEARERCAAIAKSKKTSPAWANYTPRQAAFLLPTVTSSRDWHNRVIEELTKLKGEEISADTGTAIARHR